MIYQPAEDSFLIEKEVRARGGGKRVLDVGCGSGILMEAAVSAGALEVKGVDIDSECVEFCREKGLDVVLSDLFLEVDGKFDLIVFNPPYLPFDEREDSESCRVTSGGKKGDEIIVRFLEDVGNYLAEDGRMLLVVSSLTPLGGIERVIDEKCFVKKVVSSEKVFMEGLEVWEIRKS